MYKLKVVNRTALDVENGTDKGAYNYTDLNRISENIAYLAGYAKSLGYTIYICLTNLIPELLDKVDERKLAFIPAVELLYLTKEEQSWLYDILSREEKFGVPLKQASKLKGISQSGKLTYEKIDKIFIEKVHEPPKAIKVPYKAIRDFFPPDTTPKEFEKTIQDALTRGHSRLLRTMV